MGKADPKAIQRINRPKKHDENSDYLIDRWWVDGLVGGPAGGRACWQAGRQAGRETGS